MSRYIDADALEYDTEWSEYHDGFTAYSQMAIDNAPSIDIVRCKECNWYDLNAHECTGEVNSTDHEGGASYSLNFYDDDFCSYGERTNGQTLNFTDE